MKRTRRSAFGATEKLTKLTDLPELCLDKIFIHLNVGELTSAIIVDEQFKSSAIRSFNKNFRDKLIVFSTDQYHSLISALWQPYKDVEISKVFDEYGLNIALDNFGPAITKLSIPTVNQLILNKVIEKCSLNLVHLEVLIDSSSLRLNSAQFANIHKLRLLVCGCSLNESWTKINRNFPNVRSLEIVNVVQSESKFNQSIVDRIPLGKLEKFAFRTCQHIQRKTE